MARTRTTSVNARAVLPPVKAALPIQLLRTRESVMAWFRPHLRQHGVTDHQWRVLRALAESDGLEMQELSQACEVQAPSLSRIMPKLAAQGLVQRENDPDDQRRIMAKLTVSGRELVDRVSDGSAAIYADLVDAIGRARLEELQAMLDDVMARLARPRHAAAADGPDEREGRPATR